MLTCLHIVIPGSNMTPRFLTGSDRTGISTPEMRIDGNANLASWALQPNTITLVFSAFNFKKLADIHFWTSLTHCSSLQTAVLTPLHDVWHLVTYDPLGACTDNFMYIKLYGKMGFTGHRSQSKHLRYTKLFFFWIYVSIQTIWRMFH